MNTFGSPFILHTPLKHCAPICSTNVRLVLCFAGQVAGGQGGAACPGAVGDLGGGCRRRREQGVPKHVPVAAANIPFQSSSHKSFGCPLFPGIFALLYLVVMSRVPSFRESKPKAVGGTCAPISRMNGKRSLLRGAFLSCSNVALKNHGTCTTLLFRTLFRKLLPEFSLLKVFEREIKIYHGDIHERDGDSKR